MLLDTYTDPCEHVVDTRDAGERAGGDQGMVCEEGAGSTGHGGGGGEMELPTDEPAACADTSQYPLGAVLSGDDDDADDDDDDDDDDDGEEEEEEESAV